MPFMTESRRCSRSRWPRFRRRMRRRSVPKPRREMAILQDLIVAVRNVRAELKIEPKQKLAVEIHAGREIRNLIERNRSSLERMANVESIAFVDASLANAAGAREVRLGSMCE